MVRNLARPALFTCLIALLALPARGAEVGFEETFGLAPDRAKALESLTPGTDEYFYYQALHAQNTGDAPRFQKVLAEWQARVGNSERKVELVRRQAFLDFAHDPHGALERVRMELRLAFDHRRIDPAAEAQIPSVWNAAYNTPEQRLQATLRQQGGLSDLTEAGLPLLAGKALHPDTRRNLLDRITRPDFPGLVDLVIADLTGPPANSFGGAGAHQLLTLEQLEECGHRLPRLGHEDTFVRAMLSRMRPIDQVDPADAAQRGQYLARLRAFTRMLDPVHNSLKALVLYHLLKDAQARGEHPKAEFLEYLGLPRNVPYLARNLRESAGQYNQIFAELGANYSVETGLAPIGADEELVRDYLATLLLDAKGLEGLDSFVDETYLRKLQAEARLLAGDKEMDKYAAVLSPEELQALRDRVELDIAPTNPTLLAAADPVKLTVKVKNIKNLIVKAFEINPLNLYRETGQEIDQAIDLDGLVAAHEDRFTYDMPPMQSVSKTFEFPWIQGRGVWVIELVGNGKSSRALIRKGRLHLLEEPSTAGQAFRVIDEAGAAVKDASVWIAGKEVLPDEAGRILLPFAEASGTVTAIVRQGAFASLTRIFQRAEDYRLQAQFHVDREALIEGQKALLLVRTGIQLANRPVSVKLLKDVRLGIEAVDLDGVSSREEVADFALEDDREAVHEIHVPERLASLRFVLKARVDSMRLGKPVDLTAADAVEVNAHLRSRNPRDWYLRRNAGAYALTCRGRNGEPVAGRTANVTLHHRAFGSETGQYLRTDAQGNIQLGDLPGATSVAVTGQDDDPRSWDLAGDAVSYPDRLCVTAGEEIALPLLEPADRLLPQASLLEVIAGKFAHDRTAAVKVEAGRVLITGLTPGRYDLLLRPSQSTIALEVGPGPLVAGHVRLPREAVPASASRWASLTSAAVDGKDLVIKLADTGPDTRVHVLGAWTEPAFSSFRDLLPSGAEGSVRVPLDPAESMYASGRTVGDEYRYVLERRYAPRHPGVMLDRPGLVLNPWALRDAASTVQEAQAGDAYASRQQELSAPKMEPLPITPVPPPAGARGRQDAASLDFLERPPVVLANLVPKDGEIRVPRDGLPPDVRVLITGRSMHLEHRLSLDDPSMPVRDCRLAAAFDPAQSFATTKLTTSVTAGKALEIADRHSSRLRGFGNLREAYELLSTLCTDPRFAEFRFVTDWPTLSPDEKRKKYSEFASHELSFFLRRKDPAFFASVVKPYLANKHEKTFLDHWLLEDDLTRYLDPWPYARLNVVEKILLARRTGHAEALQRLLGDRAALSNAGPEAWNQLFATALSTGALGGNQGLVAGKAERANLGMDRDSGTAVQGLIAKVATTMDSMDAEAAPAPALAMQAPAEAPALREEAAQEKEMAKDEEAFADKKTVAPSRAPRKMKASFARRLAGDMNARKVMRQLYRRADKTKELVENHYYHRPLGEQNAALIQQNDFWLDYARAGSEDGFLSGRFPQAASSVTEAMFALAALDLPFSAPPLQSVAAGAGLSVTTTGAAIVFHEEVKPTPRAAGKARVLVSQDFYPADARHRVVDGKEVDNYVSEEFLAGTPYACDVVVTNPGSLPIDLDVLVQVPAGSIPLEGAKLTRSLPVRAEPYTTWKSTYVFYFPTPGDFAHHPVEIAHRGEVIARADPFPFHVVAQLTKVDRASWDEVSQHGTDDEVLAFLKEKNLERLDLTKIAFRMQNKDTFAKIVATLKARGIFDPVLWSYGIFHEDPVIAREYVETTPLATQVGPYLATPLLTVDPVERGTYQHFDYDPLVHARAHQLGTKRQILNAQMADEYRRLLAIVAHKPALEDRDWLEVAYYLLLQDRVEEGLAAFDRVGRDKIQAKLQYDYMHAVAQMLRGDLDGARKIAADNAGCPVPRWSGRFQEMVDQLGRPSPAPAASPSAAPSVAASPATTAPELTRDQAQDRLATTEASLDLDIEAKILRISHRHVPTVTVNYYPMDVELLFSRSPFVHDQTSRFSFVAPKRTETVSTVPDQPVTKRLIPEDLQTTNLMVEVVAGGLRSSKPYFASSLTVQVIEGYGQIQVSHLDGLNPQPRIYVKAFARMKDGSVRFYKDGYTDHRQRFDYATLSTDELDQVEKFAILVLSDTLGAVVREASPPRH